MATSGEIKLCFYLFFLPDQVAFPSASESVLEKLSSLHVSGYTENSSLYPQIFKFITK